MFLRSTRASGPSSICGLFVEHFGSVYESSSQNCNNSCDNSHIADTICLSECSFDFNDVYSKILKLDCNKSPGPDEIPPIFLSGCVNALLVPITFIFNKSLSLGVFPKSWKSGYVTPIFKKGDKHDVSNYRPICLQSTLAKIFESLFLDSVMPTIANIIIPNQHGFMPKRSTLTNLAIYESYIADGLSDGYQIDSIYTDFSKAFDKVCHSLLIEKLADLGVSGPVLNWLDSYLGDRKLCVKIDDHKSQYISATSGLPQGSHLGPVLFLVFINDIANIFRGVEFLLFADDLKIYKRVKSVDDCSIIQNNLSNLYNWCSTNRLFLNVDKCKAVQFSRSKSKIGFEYDLNGDKLELLHSIRDLGVIFDDRLSFVPHISEITSRAMRSLGFILRTVGCFNNLGTIKLLYYTLVRSILEYASPIWTPHFQVHVNNIERVQRKFLRFINYKLGIPRSNLDYRFLLETMNMEELAKRRITSDLIFLYKIVNSHLDSPALLNKISLRIPARSTRNTDTFYCDNNHYNTLYVRNTIIPRLHRLGNDILSDANIDIFNLSLPQFKSRLRVLSKL
jgi:hypothetical protein